MPINYRSLFLVVIFAAALFGFKLGSYALIDMDEPRYPQAAREMIERKDYIVPYFADQPRYDKPILFYWAEILSIKAFGDNEFAARFPSALSALALVVLCFLLGNSINAGVISSLVLATSLEFFVMARLSVTDMLLNLCISATLVIFFLTYNSRSKNLFDKLPDGAFRIGSKYLLLAAVSSALGVLCKGPVALLLPGIVVVIFLLINKDLFSYIKRILGLIPWLVLIFAVLVLPWYLAVHKATAGAFTQAFFLEHNLQRYTNTLSGHDAPWYFYILVFLVGFMPWTFALPKALWEWFPSRSTKSYENDLIKFCLLWFLLVVVFYSSAGTKLINYILPCYLPLAIIAAWSLKKFSVKIVTVLISTATLALVLAVPLVIMPLSERKEAGIQKFAAMLPREVSQVYTVNIERPSVTYYTHRPAQRITSAKFTRKFQGEEPVYFVIKTGDLQDLESAKKHYQILFQDEKYSFGKSL